MSTTHKLTLIVLVMAALNQGVLFGAEQLARQPLFRVTDLNVGESQLLNLSDGSQANVKLLRIEETRDALRSALRLARVKVEVNGVIETIESGNYRLPMTVGGVQIDCPATQGLYPRHDLFEDSWGLDKDARLRLWPKGSPWLEPGSFGYPIKQRWFANVTQAGNEPSYVMGEDAPTSSTIYYHAGNDIGGAEGLDEVVAASDGLIISGLGAPPARSPTTSGLLATARRRSVRRFNAHTTSREGTVKFLKRPTTAAMWPMISPSWMWSNEDAPTNRHPPCTRLIFPV